jgi:1,4-alpha-glucan branching enzyme
MPPTVVDEEFTNPVTTQYKTMMKNHVIHKCRREVTNLEQCKLKYKSNFKLLNAANQMVDKIQHKEKRGFEQDVCKWERERYSRKLILMCTRRQTRTEGAMVPTIFTTKATAAGYHYYDKNVSVPLH